MRGAILSLCLGALLAVAGCGTSTSRQEARSASVARAGCSVIDPQAAASFYKGNVHAARPIYGPEHHGKVILRRLEGAELAVPATPGMTAQYLQRALTCHAMSETQALHTNDPLKPQGGVDVVRVRSMDGRFVVSIVSQDADAARDIWARAEAFAAGDSRVDVQVQ